jgi:hypothetical protein
MHSFILFHSFRSFRSVGRFARSRDDIQSIGITHIVNCTPSPQPQSQPPEHRATSRGGDHGVPNYFEGELQYFRSVELC